jgi:hypothetical protein
VNAYTNLASSSFHPTLTHSILQTSCISLLFSRSFHPNFEFYPNTRVRAPELQFSSNAFADVSLVPFRLLLRFS